MAPTGCIIVRVHHDIITPLPPSPGFQNQDGWFRQIELMTLIVTNQGNINDDKVFSLVIEHNSVNMNDFIRRVKEVPRKRGSER
jgi:hypothetical protein